VLVLRQVIELLKVKLLQLFVDSRRPGASLFRVVRVFVARDELLDDCSIEARRLHLDNVLVIAVCED